MSDDAEEMTDVLRRILDDGISLNWIGTKMGITYMGVRKWFKKGQKVPAVHVIRLCEILDWRVLPHEIRPDIYPNLIDGVPREEIEKRPSRFREHKKMPLPILVDA